MNKKSATKISILLISILSCLLMFSCDNPSDENPDSEDTKTTEETKTVTHSAMIGTWVNPDDSTDTITISETEVIYSATATYKFMHRVTNNNESFTRNISISHIVNEQFLNEIKARRKEWIDELGISEEGDVVRMDYTKNPKEYVSWFEKFDIEFSNLAFFQKEPSLFFGNQEYEYLWLNNEILNVRYLVNFSDEAHKDCTYIKNGSNTGNNTSSLTSSDFIGTYTISEANGSTFTFSSDGKWTYKYNSSTTNGTWSVSDGELTITYSLGGYSSTAVFTASISGDKYTLTGKSGDYTTIISSAFKITNQTALEKGVVTLVKQ